jgi:SAM-dependent methyltransferase
VSEVLFEKKGFDMSVTAQEVVYLYKAILGREAESAAIVDTHVKSGRDFWEVRQAFFKSQEFLTRNDQLLALTTQFADSARPANHIEYQANARDLSACLETIRQHWTHLGKEKAHFSVLTNPKFLPDQLAKFSDEFWSSGVREGKNLKALLARHGVNDLSGLTAAELGCGVGRVTNGLSEHFSRVYAYDISTEHLAIAAQRSKQTGRINIDYLRVTPDTFMNTVANGRGLDKAVTNHSLAACDVFYSCIVLQHNPPPAIHLMISAALHALKQGGTAVFQVPTYRQNYRFVLADWLKADHANDMQMHALPQHAVFELIEKTGCKLLEVTEDNWTGSRAFISNTFVVRKC